jgi:hypothetical protein
MSIENQPNKLEANYEIVKAIEAQNKEQGINNYTPEEMSEALAKFDVMHIGTENPANAETMLNAHFGTLRNFEGILQMFDVLDLEELNEELEVMQKQLEKYTEISTESELEDYIAKESQTILKPIRDKIQDEIQERKSALQDAQEADKIRRSL